MYKVFIIIFLICLVIIYLSNDCSTKEPFTVTSPASYSPAEQDKVVQILKDTYEMDALFNIAQIAKGLQSTTGYTVPGDLNISGKLKIGEFVFSQDGTNNKTLKINHGDKNIAYFSADEQDKIKICLDNNCTNNFSIKKQTDGNSFIGLYDTSANNIGIKLGNKTQKNDEYKILLDNNNLNMCANPECTKKMYISAGADLDAGIASNSAIGTFNIENNEKIYKLSGNSGNLNIKDKKKTPNSIERTLIRTSDTETNICAGDNCDNRQFYVKYGESDKVRSGLFNNDTNITDFEIGNKTDKKYKFRTYDNTLEIGPSKKDNTWYAATFIHNPSDTNKFRFNTNDDSSKWDNYLQLYKGGIYNKSNSNFSQIGLANSDKLTVIQHYDSDTQLVNTNSGNIIFRTGETDTTVKNGNESLNVDRKGQYFRVQTKQGQHVRICNNDGCRDVDP